jgi:hypothetical protein
MLMMIWDTEKHELTKVYVKINAKRIFERHSSGCVIGGMNASCSQMKPPSVWIGVRLERQGPRPGEV